jgi:hypothetical protein
MRDHMPERVMRNEGDPWNKTFYHRAIQTHIGRALRARYDLSQPLPDELALLVMRIDGLRENRSETSASEPASPQPRPGRPLQTWTETRRHDG